MAWAAPPPPPPPPRAPLSPRPAVCAWAPLLLLLFLLLLLAGAPAAGGLPESGGGDGAEEEEEEVAVLKARREVSHKALPFCCASAVSLSKTVPFVAVCWSVCVCLSCTGEL
eukprot:SAG22_NODE_2042_length_3090_cov_9.718823_6_plen_112_part_00